MVRTRTALTLAGILVFNLTACKPKESTPEATASPIASAAPRATASPAAMPSPTSTPAPTPTPTVLPTATPQPSPTATPSPSPSAEAVPSPDADWFKLDMVSTSNDEKVYDGTIYFIDNKAVEFPKGIDWGMETVYYLDEQSWWLVSAAEIVTLIAAQEAVQTQADKTREMLTDETTPELRRLVETLLDPQFEIEETDDTLVLSNEFMKYTIKSEQELTDDQADRFFAFRELEAYRKASTPPFAHLVVNAELRLRGIFPSEMTHSVNSAKGEPAIVHTNMKIGQVTVEEYKKVLAVLP